MNVKKSFKYLLTILALAVFNVMLLSTLLQNAHNTRYELLPVDDEKVKNLHIDVTLTEIRGVATNLNINAEELLTVLMATNDYAINGEVLYETDINHFNKIKKKMLYYDAKCYENLKNFYKCILDDLVYFPVARSFMFKEWVTYTDSWGYEREYGGNRRHEGTDIMADINNAGLYPVVSMSTGIVENIGWLELGGYRIGIRSETGVYYYYAHLDSYADGLKEGDIICAGQFLGFMGNTGYSKVEGTSGKFDVHLHMGIYMDIEGKETAFNPYYILKNLGENVLYYNY